MAITGEQISSSDALYLDLIDYHVPSDQLQALQDALVEAPSLSKEELNTSLPDLLLVLPKVSLNNLPKASVNILDFSI